MGRQKRQNTNPSPDRNLAGLEILRSNKWMLTVRMAHSASAFQSGKNTSVRNLNLTFQLEKSPKQKVKIMLKTYFLFTFIYISPQYYW